uniref:Large ribosomal subunit protein uL24c n=1 Tax=Compsothamnion thuioides TaxID=3097386 RepID=A0A4D6WUX8_9FLOR|nr:ribosomal protein L24 [Compsothamnion thuyoides]
MKKISKTKINIKQGDTVEIISGKYKGKIGKVEKVIQKKNSLIVENINIKTKHIKPKQSDESGEIKQITKQIDRSNVKIYQL